MDEDAALLERGRSAFSRGEWTLAHRSLSEARARGDLSTADLGLLGSAAWWAGEVRQSLLISEEVYHRLQAGPDPAGAAMKALSLGLLWFIRGDLVITSGWVNRARRILRTLPETVEHGYLLYLEASLALAVRDEAPAREAAARLAELGQRLAAPELTSFALALTGLADVLDGRTEPGFAQLDEAMLPVLAGRMSPEWAGEIYCTVINVCHEVADLARMRDWTAATQRWCEQFPGEVVYSGICRIHRLQLRSLDGDWDAAERAIEQSGAELVGRNNWVAGAAFYQLGEIRRLRGDVPGAREGYAQARDLGTEPQPGEALLQHATGHGDVAWAQLSAALAGGDRLSRARLLAAGVEVGLSLELVAEADELCRQLEETAEAFATPGLLAWAAQARAAVLLEQGRHEAALTALLALRESRRLPSRHETARMYELMARAHEGLGRPGPATAAAATALGIHRSLGALPDVRRLEGAGHPGGLTEREVDVLALVAAGASNRATGQALFISEKTVSRHLANIFTKLGVSTRTAAAAWGHANGVRPQR